MEMTTPSGVKPSITFKRDATYLARVAGVLYGSRMAETGGSRRDSILLDAIDPTDGKPCKVQVSHDRMMTVAKRSLGQAKECGYIVPVILQRPTAVFEGLRSDEDEDRRGVGWRCYCGVADKAYQADGSERSPWPGQVFLVFVNDEKVAYNWRWEQADADDPKLPINHDQRFKRRLL